jgi:DNA-directed RNA polymerase subunit RPC12/RpoP
MSDAPAAPTTTPAPALDEETRSLRCVDCSGHVTRQLYGEPIVYVCDRCQLAMSERELRDYPADLHVERLLERVLDASASYESEPSGAGLRAAFEAERIAFLAFVASMRDGAALRAALPREEGLRDDLLAMAERWLCTGGRPPNEVENERRKCGRELERYVRRELAASEGAKGEP